MLASGQTPLGQQDLCFGISGPGPVSDAKVI